MGVKRIALTLALMAPAAAFAQSTPQLTVVVAGSPVAFDQPPIEQAGRVYVPLRGVFERLGASVVYANGIINATADGHQISLKIGATTATVDGATQNLDSPPFLIGGRTLVPLRFISQALGATVNYDQQSQTVYVVPPGGVRAVADVPPPSYARPQPVPPQVPPQDAPPQDVAPQEAPPPAPIAMRLLRLEPQRDATVGSLRPEIAATFGEPVAADTVHVMLDDRDVTDSTYVSDRSVVYDPSFDLPPGPHVVVVNGRTPDHEPFHDRWTFTTSGPAANYISGLEPPNGTPARLGFAVSGYTHPDASVKVVATSSEAIANFSEQAEGSVAAEGTADDSGYFEIRIELPERAQSLVDVRIVSTAPDGSVAVKTLRLRS